MALEPDASPGPDGRRAPLLAGRVALVTGASSGIGAATARELSRRGAAVVLAARRRAELEAHADAIRASGGQAVAVAADLTDSDTAELLAERAQASFGRIDILVNNAGAIWPHPYPTSSPARIADLVDLNLMAAMLLTRAVLPGMLSRRQGTIISVGSVSGRVAMEPVYSATKYGLRGFSLALRRQLAGTGVSVSLVSPANIRTAMTSHIEAPLPGPELVATTIADLVTRPRREVIVPRRHYAVAWLEQALPRIADVAYRWRHWSPVEEIER